MLNQFINSKTDAKSGPNFSLKALTIGYILAITACLTASASTDRTGGQHQQHLYANGAALYPMSPAIASPDHCYRASRCRPLNTSQCLDVTLTYKHTASAFEGNGILGPDATIAWGDNAHDIHDYLSRWKGLRSVPQCWKALQSVLCAIFFPRCDDSTGRVSLPTHDMCRLTRQPCRLLEQHHHWPPWLRCDNDTLFPHKCKNDYTDLKFQTAPGVAPASKCSLPLVTTDDTNIWYPGIEGCALQCQNPVYSAEQHRRVGAFIKFGAWMSLICTGVAVLTFIIDWHSSNRYPAVIIFYLNLCFMIADTGWLAQSVLHSGHREIVCRPDNTSRYGEPGNSPDNLYCLSTFLLVYYFSMAALVWFVNLAYAWDLSFQANGASHRESVNAKVAYFHLTAWSVPLMLTISILFVGEVDGDSLRGICFVGVVKPTMRAVFVLAPTSVSLTIGCYYMFKSMLTLIKVKLITRSQTTENRNKSKKIEHMIIRIGLFVLFAMMAVIVTYVSHIYEFTHSSQWKTSLNDYIICTLNMTAALYPYDSSADTSGDMSAISIGADDSVHSCKLIDRPNLLYVYVQLVAVFGAGVCASSWVWTGNSLRGWRRFWRRRLRPDHTDPIRMKRAEMISKVFGRRHQLSQGCYSPSFHSMHSDPVAMNLNSAVSQDLSATWAAALPNFMYRRGAIAGTQDPQSHPNHYLPNFVGTRHSSNSDVSQQRSYDSYRRSLDSQYSLEQLEMVAMDRHQRRKTRKEREKMLKKSNPYHNHRRRGSDTSGSVISTALAVRAFQKAAKSECKSTSTRDLMQLEANAAATVLPQLIANPFMTPPMCSPSAFALPAPPHSTLSYMPPAVVPQRPKTKLTNSALTNFTFTHGMSDQSSQLTNPLLEKRRPDSCLPTGGGGGHRIHHNLSTANSALTVQQPLNTTPNGTVQTAPAVNYGLTYMNSGMPFMPNPQSLNYFTQPMNAFYGNLLVNNQTQQSFPNFMAPAFGPSPLPPPGLPYQYPPYPQYPPFPGQQCATIQDIQALMREREEHLALCRPLESASESE
ncbi:unnamed protein product, partial [Oppiella nova]